MDMQNNPKMMTKSWTSMQTLHDAVLMTSREMFLEEYHFETD